MDNTGLGTDHASIHDKVSAEYVPVTDDEAVDSFEYLSRMEGIIPAVESAHAVAYARKLAGDMYKDLLVVRNLPVRGA